MTGPLFAPYLPQRCKNSVKLNNCFLLAETREVQLNYTCGIHIPKIKCIGCAPVSQNIRIINTWDTVSCEGGHKHVGGKIEKVKEHP